SATGTRSLPCHQPAALVVAPIAITWPACGGTMGFTGNTWPSMAIFPGRTSRRTHGGHGTGPSPPTTQLTGEPTFPECTSVPGLAGEANQACGLASAALSAPPPRPPRGGAAAPPPARPPAPRPG